MRIVVIGASGHVGGYLVPQLVTAGHDVVAVTRGQSRPYFPHRAWTRVENVQVDRSIEEAAGTFGSTILALRPDAVVDLICFTEQSAHQLVHALRDRVRMLVHVGTIWVHGTATQVPITEAAPRHPWGQYGTQKAAIESFLLAESRGGGLPTAVVHPGHISGPGWPIINPVGNLDLTVWSDLAAGRPVAMPHLGLETVHHVHASDVAQVIRLALEQPENSVGESFHAVSDRALTLRGFAEAAAAWFGQTADLRFVPFDEFRAQTSVSFADASWEHIARSHSVSFEKAKRLLGYQPEYTSLRAVAEAVEWLRQDGQLDVPAMRFAEPA